MVFAGSSSGATSGGGTGPVILELPLDKIKRPLMRTRANDPIKVKDLMDSIAQIGLQVPVCNSNTTFHFSCLFPEKMRRFKVMGIWYKSGIN